ncbi:hypothetical protein HCN44_004069 [Aphidius gifuensis]|uniref:Gustatory receptor n=1 Tax=Aphidius gifuensis TaxID=684658 RepID=A0A834XZR7_APHGI|nr:hypothetical protein HCN44_004069 [Aphidius gifuensis]
MRNEKSGDIKFVWSMHHYLFTAANEINKLYAVQFLLWIAVFFVDSLSRIYNLTTIIGNDDTVVMVARDITITISFFVYVYVMTYFCYLTSNEANKIGNEVYSIFSMASRTTDVNENYYIL